MKLSNHDLQHFLSVAEAGARKGAEVLVKYWGKLTSYEEKSAMGDLVTQADKESEAVVLSYLKQHFPHHAFLGEETGFHEALNSDFVWAVDPLDGTTNYTHCYPMVCVSIGLIYKGKSVVGVVFNPILNECFLAAEGFGATLNGKKIHVSKTDQVANSLLGTGFAYDRRETLDNNYKEFVFMTQLSHGVRRAGAAALDLSYVAAGRLDGFWERGLQIWDMAAGVVIIEEAGGMVTSYDGGIFQIETGRILASNGIVHKELSQELVKAIC
jgi:myo-inositol-1(or 4)-monophosphatase